MRSLNIETIQNWINQIQRIWLPDFAEILDISFDESGNQLDILYQFDYQTSGSSQKMYNIWIMYSKNICTPPSDFYKFFGSVEKRFSEVNLGDANNGRIVPIEISSKYYIFIEEIKTIAENREEKLSEIL
jgi:hypothetical protein